MRTFIRYINNTSVKEKGKDNFIKKYVDKNHRLYKLISFFLSERFKGKFSEFFLIKLLTFLKPAKSTFILCMDSNVFGEKIIKGKVLKIIYMVF